MDFQQNVQLAPYTTFKIGGPAKFFCTAENLRDLKTALEFAQNHKLRVLALGGGSNVLVSDSGFEGLAIRAINKGYKVMSEEAGSVVINVGAGEAWDEIVERAVRSGWWGIENLSHIPGLAGAAAVQNIGAYGQEAAQVIVSVEAFDVSRSAVVSLSNVECKFEYRKSIFNSDQRGKYFILSITLKLRARGEANLEYGDLKKYFTEKKVAAPSLSEIRRAVTEIRDRKFPYPTEALNGNAGSFFKSPVLSEKEFDEMLGALSRNFEPALVEKISSLRDRLQVPQGYKVPYGMLIEACGLKGFKIGGAAISETHAGVILNSTGKATAKDIIDLFLKVRQSVAERTGVLLEHEPELIGFEGLELE